MAPKQKGSGGRLTRSEVVTVRLDPRLRYGVELAARKHRRTASSFIEWAIEETLRREIIREQSEEVNQATAQQMLNEVWDIDESDRFAKLALNHEEQVLWKLILECGLVWRGRYTGSDRRWTWYPSEDNLEFVKLREHWDTFKQVASGELSPKELPTWQKTDPEAKDFDNDIPF